MHHRKDGDISQSVSLCSSQNRITRTRWFPPKMNYFSGFGTRKQLDFDRAMKIAAPLYREPLHIARQLVSSFPAGALSVTRDAVT